MPSALCCARYERRNQGRTWRERWSGSSAPAPRLYQAVRSPGLLRAGRHGGAWAYDRQRRRQRVRLGARRRGAAGIVAPPPTVSALRGKDVSGELLDLEQLNGEI